MNIKIFKSFFFTCTIVYASNYPNFTKYELNNIKKHSGQVAKNRALDYTETIESLKKLPIQKRLDRVNFYLNQLPTKSDMVNHNKSDYWETPKEFLTCGYGDCEDYAIIKYFTLLKLGFSKDKLFITTAYEKYTGQYHMVLSYFESKNKPPLILDNLSFKILDLNTRVDLKADIFINSTGTYKINKNNILMKLDKEHPKFKELMQRVIKES
ncbi:transglutaminase-like cysteine peptidase [Candidatus Sulfurimonas baltica]|uniref:Transglutaminase-like cysteine peptidase n=1 Tax=Candidatus Sulfurimonas baltica TaxID=2740404 RepID=A0A7S7LWI8_9BACT|nr:transglutaminase-like cysteine peptidase [Candidatus Sulfurimonas baltica]QOY52727.1 transglutaminase-like cysteine peptidase [Candidatus Sulfurimonas baltica]